ncbi:ATP-binding protein [Butyrivibrio fibrisolvens]|uniref:ATPase n=1 Tax=Butyrivibrio fibrisolvens TaxID=831 RepID=A0A317G2E4_BUTFI|nr:ATP-binding protein [Butyrivibrio fibrisolvens]PWT26590.1 ATPase [Butyrivibrio fibrisolvens]PWT27216.1 ATPase [Butyrivibrio fibrisolvens]
MKIIERKNYLNRLIRLKDTPDIKIITGLRRSGKSELVRAYMELIRTNEDTNIIYVDFADLKFDDLKTYKELYNFCEGQYIDGKTNVIVVDEVQMCEKFELAINSLYNSRKYDIYITGSNAFLLSSDLSTLFTGRFIEIPVYPFSFAEYCEYYGYDSNTANVLDSYVMSGGLSGAYVYSEKEDQTSYIKDVYTTIIKRDLVDKYGIKEEALLDSLTDYMMDNISNLTSASKISNVFKQNKVETNHITIGNYMKYLCSAFMFYKVKRYDIRGKKYLETSDKYYLSDLGFRYAMLGTRNMDYGRAYENIVALELLRRGYEIYVGKLYQKEIDFVAMKQNEKLYIQVSDNISDSDTLERELSPLRAIKDAYPKILIANTKHDDYDIEGIKVLDLTNWLMR